MNLMVKKLKDKWSARAMRPPIKEKLTQGFYTTAFPQPSEVNVNTSPKL